MATTSDFIKMLSGYGLTTALILYQNPDKKMFINGNWYLWQEYDTFPAFPLLQRFVKTWNERNDGKVVHVEVAHSKLIKPAELKVIGSEFRLN
jgi:uncharacterized protein Usg